MTLVLALDAAAISRAAAYSGYAALGLLAATYISQLETRYFIEWKFDASTKQLAKQIAADHAAHPKAAAVRVGSTWVLQNSLNFYRKRQHLGWMSEVQRSDLQGAPFDYYVLVGDDRSLIEKLRLRVLYTDGLSGAVVASRS
jgi:hypothetical protein